MRARKDTGGGGTLVELSMRLREAVSGLTFRPPVVITYNPLEYAWEPYKEYLQRYGTGKKRVVFLGMNPGPWGMAQTGIPFGEVSSVRDWMGISGRITTPSRIHPARPVTGFNCRRSEVSGRRLWDFFRDQYDTPGQFFRRHFVANYCPLLFLDRDGRNITPDRLCAADRDHLLPLCDRHLAGLTDRLRPEWVVGIGRFAAKRAGKALAGSGIRVGGLLHPSPASPAANRGWSGQAMQALREQGIWAAPVKEKENRVGEVEPCGTGN